MKDNFAKMLFEMMGSQQLPTAHRKQFIDFFNNYQNAISKAADINDLTEFLEKNKQIGSFSVDFSYRSDDEGGSYKCPENIRFSTPDGKKFDDEEDLESQLYDTLINGEHILEIVAGNRVSLATIPHIFKESLTKQEATALDMVDNYERNQLNAEIIAAPKQKQVKL